MEAFHGCNEKRAADAKAIAFALLGSILMTATELRVRA
jgi:hypothetical protein